MQDKNPLTTWQKNGKLSGFIGYLWLAVLYCASIAYTIHSVTLLRYSMLETIICCTFFILLFYILTYNKITIIITSSVIIAGAILLFILDRISYYWSEYLLIIQRYISNMFSVIMGARFQQQYAFAIFLVICAFCALFTTIFIKKLYNFFALLIAGILLFSAETITGVFKAPIAFFMFLVSMAVLFMITPRMHDRKNKKINKAFGMYAHSALPLCLVCIIIASIIALPFSTYPDVSIEAGNQIKTFEDVLNLFSSSERNAFNLRKTGFSPDPTRLGGDISLDHTSVLSISADQPVMEKLYLKGSTKRIYNGQMWLNSDSDFEPYEPDSDRLIFNHDNMFASLTVRPLDREISTLFLTTNYYNIDVGDSRLLQNDEEIRVRPSIRRNDSYSFEFSYYSENADDFYSSYYGDKYNNLFNENGEILYGRITDGEYDNYTLNYIEEIRSQYLQLPDTVTDRVYELAHKITDKCDSDYEKAKAIEDYLRTLVYTLKPGSLPDGYDFVDYFLFESKEGYCTYFATAMCVLARAVGIPSRFVTGYAGPNSLIEGQTVVITNAQAHAWPEIFIEGLGWVQFEPTPPYAYARYNDDMPIIIPDEDPELIQHIKDIAGENDQTDSESTSESSSESESIISSSSSQSSQNDNIDNLSININWTVILIIIALLIITVIAIIIFIICYRFKKYKRYLHTLSIKDSGKLFAAQYFKAISILMALNGENKLPYETAMQFAEKYNDKYNSLFSLKHIAEIYNKAYYGNIILSDQEKQDMILCYDKLNKFTKDRLGLIKYFIKYILLMGWKK